MSHRRTVGLAAIAVAVVFAASALQANPDRNKSATSRVATLEGRIVDLQNHMTGKYKSSDRKRCTEEAIRAGVPIAIDTENGLVIIGQGMQGPQKTIAPFAYELVELTGRYYERNGVRYIDIASAKAAKPAPEPEKEAEEESWTPEPDEPEEDDPNDESADTGACCLPNGACKSLTEDACNNEEGEYFYGESCDDIECDPRK